MNPSGVACSLPRPGIWATIASALGYSLCSVCAKKISEEYSPFQALYVRGLITTILAIGILMHDTSLPIPHKAVRVFAGWAFGRGVLGAIVLGTYYYALTILPLSEAAVLLSLGPITSTVASRIGARGADHRLSHLFPSLARDWGRVCLRSRCFVHRIQE